MYNGFDWYGRTLEVREVSSIAYLLWRLSAISHSATQDRYAGLSGASGFRGGLRGGGRGLRGGLRGGGFRGGGLRGGFAGSSGPGGGRDFNRDIYADYSGPDAPANPTGPSFNARSAAGAFNDLPDAEPSKQIMVRNVCISRLSSPRNCFLTRSSSSCRGPRPTRI